MDSKFYISYKAAMLLKEKGYNEATDYIIDEDDCMMNSHYILNEDLSEYICSCPTKSEAIDWLESKGIVVCVYLLNLSIWGYTIIVHKDKLILGDFFKDKNRLEVEDSVIIKALELL